MKNENLQNRTKIFAVRIIKLGTALPKNSIGNIISKQIIRSGTSVGANYRAACVARSNKELSAKLNIVLEEVDETCYWLEIIKEIRLIKESKLTDLYDEANQLKAIMLTSLKTLKKKGKDK